MYKRLIYAPAAARLYASALLGGGIPNSKKLWLGQCKRVEQHPQDLESHRDTYL